MEAIKKHILVESDVLKIPELKNFIGKHMELILIEEEIEKDKGRLEDFFNLAGNIEFDEEKINELRNISKI
jgi:hypothetical protein